MNEVNITLVTANTRPAGRGQMTICDANVDGQNATVIFWDPLDTLQPQLAPGFSFAVEMDGNNAKWNTHNGKQSFQIKPTARITVVGGAAPVASQPAAATFAPTAPAGTQAPMVATTPNKSATEILTRAGTLTEEYYGILCNHPTLPTELIIAAAAEAPKIVSSWWFGQDNKWA